MSAVVELVLALAVGLGVAIIVQSIPHRSPQSRSRIVHDAIGKL